jgi:hypothetical protein
VVIKLLRQELALKKGDSLETTNLIQTANVLDLLQCGQDPLVVGLQFFYTLVQPPVLLLVSANRATYCIIQVL